RAGLEGGVRYAEDLARWAKDDPQHELRNGTDRDSIGMPVSEVLQRVHLYMSNINPDGWARGDAANGGVFQRGNGNGVDLNREFPTKGWTAVDHTPVSEPESKAWVRITEDLSPVTSADLHGELT
ncbi:MAG: M14 family zinc carboxypeptidase, partial [Actinomycetota bacterium]